MKVILGCRERGRRERSQQCQSSVVPHTGSTQAAHRQHTPSPTTPLSPVTGAPTPKHPSSDHSLAIVPQKEEGTLLDPPLFPLHPPNPPAHSYTQRQVKTWDFAGRLDDKMVSMMRYILQKCATILVVVTDAFHESQAFKTWA